MDKKVERVVSLYERLLEGHVIRKAEESARFSVNERTIQRDLDDIRAICAEQPERRRELVYDRQRRGYVLVDRGQQALTNSEVLTVCKILLESRSLVRDEMMPIIDKLLQCCVPYENLQKVRQLIANEKHHYLEPHHGRAFVDIMWDIGTAVYEHRLMRIHYHKLKGMETVERLVQPVGILFSEYYFYLCAFISKSAQEPNKAKYSYPTIYRIDRIDSFEILKEHFQVPYADRFEEGEFRKRVQFMFGGDLRTIRFRYTGLSIESVLDRFPTAEIIDQDDHSWTISAEVYGDGAMIWLRGQADRVEMLE